MIYPGERAAIDMPPMLCEANLSSAILKLRLGHAVDDVAGDYYVDTQVLIAAAEGRVWTNPSEPIDFLEDATNAPQLFEKGQFNIAKLCAQILPEPCKVCHGKKFHQLSCPENKQR